MQLICDLHLHSRFSRSTSQKLTVGTIASICRAKGVQVIGSGDAVHPIWLRELRQNLQETSAGSGLYFFPKIPEVKFLLTVEISLMYRQGDHGRRNHLLILLPSLEIAQKVQKKFHQLGNITSDGRPIFGINSRDIVEMLLLIDRQIVIIPAHIWTPWFSMFGSKSGFNSIEECFGDLGDEIKAVETGLSADPAMCWRVSELDKVNIISSGDAHSPAKIMREATLLEVSALSYQNIRQAIIRKENRKKKIENSSSLSNVQCQMPDVIKGTIEFFPEEGKYHWSGHAICQVAQSAEKTQQLGTNCPVCGKPMILGVEWRTALLATRSEKDLKINNNNGWIYSKLLPHRPPYKKLVPLDEIIAETFGVKSTTSVKVLDQYYQLTTVWSEIRILLDVPIAEIKQKFDGRLAEAIERVRNNQLTIKPGYDGIYGKINIWKKGENTQKIIDLTQSTLFSA